MRLLLTTGVDGTVGKDGVKTGSSSFSKMIFLISNTSLVTFIT